MHILSCEPTTMRRCGRHGGTRGYRFRKSRRRKAREAVRPLEKSSIEYLKLQIRPLCLSAVIFVPLAIESGRRIARMYSAVLRKNTVWTLRLCQVSFDQTRILWAICEFMASNHPQNSICHQIWTIWKFQELIFIILLQNNHYIGGNLATHGCSYDVLPQHGSKGRRSFIWRPCQANLHRVSSEPFSF